MRRVLAGGSLHRYPQPPAFRTLQFENLVTMLPMSTLLGAPIYAQVRIFAFGPLPSCFEGLDFGKLFGSIANGTRTFQSPLILRECCEGY